MGDRRWPSAVMQIVGLLVAALALTWTVAHLVPTTVRSPAGLRDVGFGWPFRWYHQDLSRYDPAGFRYPAEMQIVGDRVDPVPSTVDGIALTGDVLLTALAIWGLWSLVAVPLIRRAVGDLPEQNREDREAHPA